MNTHQQPSSKEWEKLKEDFCFWVAMESDHNPHLYLGSEEKADWWIKQIQSLLTSHSQAIRERVEAKRMVNELAGTNEEQYLIDAEEEYVSAYNRAVNEILALLTDDKNI